MWSVRAGPSGSATSLSVSVPRLAMRSCQVVIGLPSLVCRLVRFSSAARDGHMRLALAPILFADHQPGAGREAVRRVVGDAHGIVHALGAHHRCDGTERFLLVHPHGRRDVIEHVGVDQRTFDGAAGHQLPSQPLPTITQCFSRVGVEVAMHLAVASSLAASRVGRTAQPKPRVPGSRSHAIAGHSSINVLTTSHTRTAGSAPV